MEFQTTRIEHSLLVNCRDVGETILEDYTAKNGQIHSKYLLTRQKDKHVALVGGGMSAEREVSMMSSNGIFRSLLELDYDVTFVDMGVDIAEALSTLKPDLVFNGLHGTYGEDGCLQGLLNIMHIPYTGAGLLASAIAFNKRKSIDVFKSSGIKLAESISVFKGDGVKSDPMPRPYVIKPVTQGSSVGVEVIFEGDDFEFAEYTFPYGEEVLVEKYVPGREIQIPVLNGIALGTIEVKLLKGQRFNDYTTKYRDGYAEHLVPADVPDDVNRKGMQIAEQATAVIGASGMVRADFRYDEEEGEFYLLELNTLPGMTPLSMCPEVALKIQGMSYTEVVRSILETARYE